MEEKRIGVYVCWCGTNIAKMVDVQKIAKEINQLKNVVISRDYKYMCSDPGQELIINDIKEHKLNRVVVAACSPRIHELTFRKALEHAGLNPYMFQMANIREQVSWVHSERERATRKAQSLVEAAVKRVLFHEPLDKRTVPVNPATLVIGAGIAGMTAALELADANKKVFLVEKDENPGGIAARIDLTFPFMTSTAGTIHQKIRKIKDHPKISLFTDSRIEEINGYVGNFEAIIKPADKRKQKVKFGNIIVATGLKPFNPDRIAEYKTAFYDDVYTSLDFESKLTEGKIVTSEGKIPKNVAILHCVGSRNPGYHEYCSRVCCNTALKYISQIQTALPDTHVYDIYADMRAYGKGCEELYTHASKNNTMFLLFNPKNGLPEINRTSPGNDYKMTISMHELLSGEDIEIPADMVILMVGMEAHADARDVAHETGISLCGNEFFIEKHPKLDPVATTTEGVFIAGSCQGPKDIAESVAQAKAAAARVLATISQGEVKVETTTAHVNSEICCGCQTCIKVCPYSAIHFDEENSVSVVNEVLCKGCGTCGSACPTGAIRSRHFTDEQILSQIEGLLVTEI